MSFPRYPAFKDSGVEWLGEVPAHWGVDRLKRLAAVFPSNVDKKSYEGDLTVRLCNYTDVYYNDFITADMELMTATATAEQVEKFTLRSGDSIITKDSETADDIAISAYVPNDLPGVVCGYHLSVIRPSAAASGAFVKRLFDAAYVRSSVAVRANGLTRVGLGQYAIDNLELPFPPLAEQRAIAAFLDRETSKIDELVAEQQRLMELLKVKRQAILSHVVTKGLNPDAPMKDSGVRWLGEVPRHWEVKRLKHVSPQVTVGIVVEPSKFYVDDGVPALRSLNVAPGKIVLENLVYLSPASNELHAKSKLFAGDLVAVRSGQPGTTAIIPAELDGCNCIDLLVIRRPTVGSERFLCRYLASDAALAQFSSGSGGAIQQHFNVGTASDLIVSVPPATEQERIATMLEEECARMDELVAEARTAISLLLERRTALISAAVTGQIDVRNLAPAAV